MSLTINNNKIYITLPDEYSYVYEEILKRMTSLKSSLLNDCDSTCKSANKQVTICWNMFQAACAAYQRNEFKKANLFINYIKACLGNKVNDDIPKVKSPTISFTNNVVTITADDEGSVLMYRTINDKKWTTYTQPIQLKYGIYIIAKAIYKGVESNETNPIFCIYTPKPIINCFKNIVNITNCSMSSQIKYKINSGSYRDYTEPFTIDETCVVTGKVIDSNEYGTNEIESVPTECEYIGNLPVPTISFLNNVVTMQCEDIPTPVIQIKYKDMDIQNDTWHDYSGPISINMQKRYKAKSVYMGVDSEESEIAVCLYTEKPVVTCNQNTVSISGYVTSGDIIYTLDDSSIGHIYNGPFNISQTCTVTPTKYAGNKWGSNTIEGDATICVYTDLPIINFANIQISTYDSSSSKIKFKVNVNGGIETNVKLAYSDNNTKPIISGTVETCTYNPSTQLYETDDYINYTTKKYIRCYAESTNAGGTSKIYSDTYVLEDNGGVPTLNIYQPILPTVTTYGNVVTINNVEPSVAILYKIDNGSYQPYSTPFQIDHTVTVTAKVVTTGGDELYSTPTICNYVDPTTIPIPTMTFNNNKVSFSQPSSLQVDIYYKKNDGVDDWHKFGGVPISINQTTNYVTKGIWQGIETNVSSPMEAIYTPVPIVTCYGNTVTITP